MPWIPGGTSLLLRESPVSLPLAPRQTWHLTFSFYFNCLSHRQGGYKMDLVSSLPTELPTDKEGIIIIGVPYSCIKLFRGIELYTYTMWMYIYVYTAKQYVGVVDCRVNIDYQCTIQPIIKRFKGPLHTQCVKSVRWILRNFLRLAVYITSIVYGWSVWWHLYITNFIITWHYLVCICAE